MIDDLTPYQDNIASHLGIICGISFCLIYILLSKILRKLALKNIEAKLEPDESIVCEGKMNFIEFIIPFAMGGFLGEYIIPFMIFPEIQRVNIIYRQDLFLCYLGELFCLFYAIVFASWKCVFTNKRMLNGFSFKFIYWLKFFGEEFLLYSNIERIEYKFYILSKILFVILKNNKRTRLPNFRNKNEILSVVQKHIGGN